MSEPAAPAPRVVVARGGQVDDATLAAVAVALSPVVVAGDDGPARSGPPAWTRAALREQVGERIVTAAGDLYPPHRDAR